MAVFRSDLWQNQERSLDHLSQDELKPVVNLQVLDTYTLESNGTEDFKLEKRVLDYIRNGRVDELREEIKEIHSSTLTVAKLANNIIRSLKNAGIGSIAICARASIEGGVSYRTKRIQIPEGIKSTIKEVYQLIDERIYSKVNIGMLAEILNISSSNLSHMFTKETGTSIMEYIRQRKIEEACYLLE